MPLSLQRNDLLCDKNYLAGTWKTAALGATFAVNDPADESLVARVPDSTSADARQAADAAHEAFPAWKARPARERAQIVKRWHAAIMPALG